MNINEAISLPKKEREKILYERYGVCDKLPADVLLLVSVGGNGESHLSGTAAEIYSYLNWKDEGCEAVKIDDNDRSRKYDHEVKTKFATLRTESKMASSKGKVNIANRDDKTVMLCEGEGLITGMRCAKNESFDVLEINITRQSKDWQDIIYIKEEDLPRFKVRRNKKGIICNKNKNLSNLSPASLAVLESDFYESSVDYAKLKHYTDIKSLLESYEKLPQAKV